MKAGVLLQGSLNTRGFVLQGFSLPKPHQDSTLKALTFMKTQTDRRWAFATFCAGASCSTAGGAGTGSVATGSGATRAA